MRTLVIETATPVLSVALFADDQLRAHHHQRIGRGHAESLLPVIAALPKGGRAERIMVSCGPGSFTGIRVGLAAAQALAFAWDAQLTGYDTLALIGCGAALPPDRPRAVAVHGGHGEYFVAEPGLAPVSLTLDAAAAAVHSADIVGDAAAELVAARGRGNAHPAEADARLALLLPSSAILPAAAPVYGRPPDARPAAS